MRKIEGWIEVQPGDKHSLPTDHSAAYGKKWNYYWDDNRRVVRRVGIHPETMGKYEEMSFGTRPEQRRPSFGSVPSMLSTIFGRDQDRILHLAIQRRRHLASFLRH